MRIFYQINMFRPLKCILNLGEDHLMIGFQSGDFNFYRVTSTKEKLKICQIETDKTKDHYDEITAFDFNEKLKLLISSCIGGLLKIWHMPSKTLMSEIKFPDKIDSACFMRKNEIMSDILIGHEKRVSLIKFETYCSKEYLEYLNGQNHDLKMQEISNKIFHDLYDIKADSSFQQPVIQLPNDDERTSMMFSPLTLKAE